MSCPFQGPGEQVQDLQRGGLRILQKEKGFRFGTDAVLLADFCAKGLGRRAAEIGTGTGVIALLCCARNPRVSLDAFEIHPDMADMAARSVAMNGMEDRIRIHAMDGAEAPAILGIERMDAVVTNPPYQPKGTGLTPPDPGVALAREQQADIFSWVSMCARLIRFGGRFYAVYPAWRLSSMFSAMEKVHLTPKRIRMVAARIGQAPKLFLVEGMKGAGEGLTFLPTLYTHDDAGFTEEMQRIYGENV